mmetsp:Transcript_40712/g.95558  ORF Transcript_40712/g.95558 Transcript_40712/m.95558 type:complete len:103 (-) Transcript_40712:3924-4232(-)
MNEESMLDWEGYIVPPTQRTRFVLSDVDNDAAMVSLLIVSAAESDAIDKIMKREEEEDSDYSFPSNVPSAVDDVSKHLSSISAIYGDRAFLEKMVAHDDTSN